jgi:hypothetical protein
MKIPADLVRAHPIIHCVAESLFAAQVALSCFALRRVPAELNLFQFTTYLMAKTGTGRVAREMESHSS